MNYVLTMFWSIAFALIATADLGLGAYLCSTGGRFLRYVLPFDYELFGDHEKLVAAATESNGTTAVLLLKKIQNARPNHRRLGEAYRFRSELNTIRVIVESRVYLSLRHARKRRLASALYLGWWTAWDSNPRPRRCERRALPAELAAHFGWQPYFTLTSGQKPVSNCCC